MWPWIGGRQAGFFGEGETKGNETGPVPLTMGLSISKLVLPGKGMHFFFEAAGTACLILCHRSFAEYTEMLGFAAAPGET